MAIHCCFKKPGSYSAFEPRLLFQLLLLSLDTEFLFLATEISGLIAQGRGKCWEMLGGYWHWHDGHHPIGKKQPHAELRCGHAVCPDLFHLQPEERRIVRGTEVKLQLAFTVDRRLWSGHWEWREIAQIGGF